MRKICLTSSSTNVGVSAFYMFIQMLSMKWDGSPATLSEHIAAISAADAKLTAMKKQIDWEFLAFILLHSLPDDNVWELFRATVLNSTVLGKALAFSDLSDCLTFTAAAQQGASSEATLKANVNIKQKTKPKSDTWCELHRSTTHNTSECRTIKEQREKRKKMKGKEKAKAKANHASHDSDSNDGDSEDSGSNTGGGTAKYSSTRSAHVSKALMSRILAYVGSASSRFPRSSTIANSGASAHMTPYREWFKCGTFQELNPPRKVRFGDNSFVNATGIGTISLECEVDGKARMTELKHALYVPSFHLTLISVHQLDKAGLYTVFKNGTCKIKTTKKRKVVLTGSHKNDLYHLDILPVLHAHASIDVNTLHRCLGHVSSTRLVQMVNDGAVEGIDKVTGKLKFCEPCVLAKSKKLPFKHKGQKATHPFQIIHSDVGGPVTPADHHGNRYWSSFIDGYS